MLDSLKQVKFRRQITMNRDKIEDFCINSRNYNAIKVHMADIKGNVVDFDEIHVMCLGYGSLSKRSRFKIMFYTYLSFVGCLIYVSLAPTPIPQTINAFGYLSNLFV